MARPLRMYGLNIPELAPSRVSGLHPQIRRAFRKPDRAAWGIREWMLDIADQDAYVAKLARRIMEIKGRADHDVWRRSSRFSASISGPDDRTTPPSDVGGGRSDPEQKGRAHCYGT